MRKRVLWICVIALSMLSAACHTAAVPEQTEDLNQQTALNPETSRPEAVASETTEMKTGEAETEKTKSSDSATTVQSLDNQALKNLDADGGLISDRYFKAGDIRTALSFSLPLKGEESDRLTCDFLTQNSTYESFWNITASAVLKTERGKTTFHVTPEFKAAALQGTVPGNNGCEITFNLKDTPPHITVRGVSGLEGDYYSFRNSFTRPDLFTRYLCKADLYLYPTEDLWLLRNEIYAAHGREFDSEVLNHHFSAMSWYRALLEPDEFSESLLSDIEKKNILLIRKLEEEPFPERNLIDGLDYASEYDRLPSAPYLSYLHYGQETGLSADLAQAKDRGVYYAAPGSISVPASITPEQFLAVQSGGETEVILNALTGESQMLSLDPDADDSGVYGYLMYDKGSDPASQDIETGLSPDLENGTYTLWQTSADTVMKTVYEGDIYILKGAVSGAYTSLSEASKSQKEIFSGAAPGDGLADGATDGIVFGNELYYNSKGYFTAVYSLGD